MALRPEERVEIYHTGLDVTSYVDQSSVENWRQSGWIPAREKPIESAPEEIKPEEPKVVAEPRLFESKQVAKKDEPKP